MTAADALKQKYREACINLARERANNRSLLIDWTVDAVLDVIAADMGEKDLIRDEDGIIREWWMVEVFGDEVSA